ncbi:MAG: sterol desaturase family protein [bacterium]|nr:sterol desaturase family protein [bacterium]
MIFEIVSAFLVGAFGWTFMEYVIHRWLGHDPRLRPNPFATEHVRHHGQGNYFAPSWKKGAAAIATTVILLGPAVWIAGWSAGIGGVVGFVSMYLGYEILHRREHTHPGIGPYMRWLRRHHFHHHFTNPRENHGVTTPLWDWVFGTYRPAGVIGVPAKLQMAWLADAETGLAKPAYAEHYELLG